MALGRYFPYHVDGVDVELKGIVDSDEVEKLGGLKKHAARVPTAERCSSPSPRRNEITNVKGEPSL